MESQSLDSLKNNYQGNFQEFKQNEEEPVFHSKHEPNGGESQYSQEELKGSNKISVSGKEKSRFSMYMQEIHGDQEGVTDAEGSVRVRPVSIYKIRKEVHILPYYMKSYP
jgi:hypothetical protein